MAQIKNERPLSLDRLRQRLNYDAVTGAFTWREQASPRAPIGSVAGIVRKHGYRIVLIDGIQYKASRLAWFYTCGEWPVECLDHINGVRSDDRLCNLRQATIADNAANKISRAKSGIKGVYKTSEGNRYFVSIMRHGTRSYLGTYTTLEEATAVRKAAALKVQGNFALEARDG